MAYRWTEEDLRNTLSGRRAHAIPAPPAHTMPVDAPAQVLNDRLRAAMTSKSPKNSKYRNKRVRDAEGLCHDSTKELRRWNDLQLRERSGEITGLRRQVPFACVVGRILVCQYVADFVYTEGAALVVEDCKSPPTRKLAAYRIKAKLMQAIHGIQIREV